MPVTASGVSAANVVATIEVPASHHGTLRPERKNSSTLVPRARLVIEADREVEQEVQRDHGPVDEGKLHLRNRIIRETRIIQGTIGICAISSAATYLPSREFF